MSFGGLFNLARQGISKPSGQAGDHSFSSTALSLMCPWQHQFSFDGAGHARSPGRPPHRVHRAASRALPRAGAAGPTPHPPSPGVAAGARLLNRHTGRAATCAAAARHARRAPSKTHRGGGVERDGSRRQAALPRPLLPPNTVMGSGEWSEKPSPAWTDRRGAVSKQEEEVSSYAPRGLHHPPTHPPPSSPVQLTPRPFSPPPPLLPPHLRLCRARLTPAARWRGVPPRPPRPPRARCRKCPAHVSASSVTAAPAAASRSRSRAAVRNGASTSRRPRRTITRPPAAAAAATTHAGRGVRPPDTITAPGSPARPGSVSSAAAAAPRLYPKSTMRARGTRPPHRRGDDRVDAVGGGGSGLPPPPASASAFGAPARR